jgi:hypothetical protein
MGRYGTKYFVERAETFGQIPLATDYVYADYILKKLSKIEQSYTERTGVGDPEWLLDILLLLPKMCSSRPRLANALPRDLGSFHDAVQVGTAALALPNRIRPLEWLELHGRCLDNIRPGVSTIPQAGRGAFATRPIRQGDIITTVPLVHLRRHQLEIYGSGEGSVWQEGAQQLLNYCYGHPESSLLLFPYSPVVNYVNHNLTRYNAELKWSTFPYHKRDWLLLSPDELVRNEHAGLVMELVATRDVETGEEIFLSYGQAWDDAWQRHVAMWSPSEEDQRYTSSATLNEQWAWMYTASERPNDSRANENDIVTVCFVGRLDNEVENTNSQGETVVEVQWQGRENLYDNSDRAYPCVIRERQYKFYHDEAHVYDRRDSIRPVDLTFTVLLQLPNKVTTVQGVPRSAIRFWDAEYLSDDNLRTAFRHEIQVPDSMIPEAWRDLSWP